MVLPLPVAPKHDISELRVRLYSHISCLLAEILPLWFDPFLEFGGVIRNPGTRSGEEGREEKTGRGCGISMSSAAITEYHRVDDFQ